MTATKVVPLTIKLIPFDSDKATEDMVTEFGVLQVPKRGDKVKWLHIHEDEDVATQLSGVVDHVNWDFTIDEVEVYVGNIQAERA